MIVFNHEISKSINWNEFYGCLYVLKKVDRFEDEGERQGPRVAQRSVPGIEPTY